LQAVALQAEFGLFAARCAGFSSILLKTANLPEQNKNSLYQSTYGAIFLDYFANC